MTEGRILCAAGGNEPSDEERGRGAAKFGEGREKAKVKGEASVERRSSADGGLVRCGDHTRRASRGVGAESRKAWTGGAEEKRAEKMTACEVDVEKVRGESGKLGCRAASFWRLCTALVDVPECQCDDWISASRDRPAFTGRRGRGWMGGRGRDGQERSSRCWRRQERRRRGDELGRRVAEGRLDKRQQRVRGVWAGR